MTVTLKSLITIFFPAPKSFQVYYPFGISQLQIIYEIPFRRDNPGLIASLYECRNKIRGFAFP